MSQEVLTTKLSKLQRDLADMRKAVTQKQRQIEKDLLSVAKVVRALQDVVVGGRAELGTISATGITKPIVRCK